MYLVIGIPVGIILLGAVLSIKKRNWGDLGAGLFLAVIALFVLFLFSGYAGTFLSPKYELIESRPLAELNGSYTQPYYQEDGTLIVGYGYVAESGEIRLVEDEFGDDLLVEVDPETTEPRVETYQDHRETWWAIDINDHTQVRLIVPEFPFEIRIPTGK